MPPDASLSIAARIAKIRALTEPMTELPQNIEAAALAQTVLHDTIGGSHPLMKVLANGIQNSDWVTAMAGSKGVIDLFDQGALVSPRLVIAHEIEGSIVDIAQSQVEAAEKAPDGPSRQLHLAIGAFLAGAAVEDALRRLCESHGLLYDVSHSTIAKLQMALYQPSKQIEVISASDNKQLTAWGDTRNKADHGKFGELTLAEVMSMVIGVRGFMDRHLP